MDPVDLTRPQDIEKPWSVSNVPFADIDETHEYRLVSCFYSFERRQLPSGGAILPMAASLLPGQPRQTKT